MEPKHTFPNIHLNQVVLTQFTPKMIPKYHTWMQDPDLQRDTCTEQLSLDEVENLIEVWSRPNVYTFIICDKERFTDGSEEESMIGDLNLFVNEGDGEVNLMLAEKEFRRRGIAKEVLQFVIGICREVLRVERVVGKIREGNEASIGLFRKSGFVEFGRIEEFGEVHFELKLKD